MESKNNELSLKEKFIFILDKLEKTSKEEERKITLNTLKKKLSLELTEKKDN